jgi:hypothetical protein
MRIVVAPRFGPKSGTVRCRALEQKRARKSATQKARREGKRNIVVTMTMTMMMAEVAEVAEVAEAKEAGAIARFSIIADSHRIPFRRHLPARPRALPN